MVPGEEASKWARLAERIVTCNSNGIPIPADLGEEFAAQVRSYCRLSVSGRRFPYDIVQEITQHVVVRSWEALSQFRGPRGGDSLFRWIQRIVSNSVATREKTKRREWVGEAETNGESFDPTELGTPFWPRDADADGRLVAHDLQQKLRAVLAQLPDRQRRAWLMHHVGGLLFCEIAQTLEITENAAKMAASRATKALQRVIDEYDGSEPARMARVGEGFHEK